MAKTSLASGQFNAQRSQKPSGGVRLAMSSQLGTALGEESVCALVSRGRGPAPGRCKNRAPEKVAPFAGIFGRAGKMKICAAAATLVFRLANLAHAQDSQFFFDANGNLLTQTAENLAFPQILAQPQVQVVGPGELASFFVVVADTRDLTYQWRFNGVPLSGIGATNDTLLLTNVGTNNEGQYSVLLVNGSGSVTSAPAMLWFDGDGDGLPDTWEGAYFTNLNQTATGDFDGDGVSNLQEFLDGTNPTNSASVRYHLTLLNDAGTVDIVPNQRSFTNGEVVTLTATAFAPGVFRSWNGDLQATNNPITLTMNTNKTVFALLGTAYDVTWTNGSGGDWNVWTNWSPNVVPLKNENVFFLSTVSVTNNGANECTNLTLGPFITATLGGSGTLAIHGTLQASNANLTANSAVNAQNFNLGGVPAFLDGTGMLTVSNVFNWTAGTMRGSGRTIIAPGAALNILNGDTIYLFRALENGGTAIWSGSGGLVADSGAFITNRAGALFEAQNNTTFSWSGQNGSPRFDNAGTFRKRTGTGTTTFGSYFALNNYGAAEIQTGTLSLGGGGAHSGSFEVLAGAALTFPASTYTASGTSSLTGAGQFNVSGATVTLAGLVNVSGSNTFSGGTANLTGNYICTNNTVTISGATANFSGTGLVWPAVLNFTGGTLTGTSTVTVNNVMNWIAGTMAGTGRTIIAPGATLNLANASEVGMSVRTLENGGAILWTGTGNLSVGDGAIITNRPGALFEAQNNTAFFAGNLGGAPRFDNAGTFRKTSTGATSFAATFSGGPAFNNYGTAEIQAGTLLCNGAVLNNGSLTFAAGSTNRLAGGGSASGTFTVPATASLEWTVNTFTLNPGALLGGAGVYQVNDATFIANTDVGVQNFNLIGSSSPILNGTGTITVNKVMNWTAGTMRGSGRTIIAPAATLSLANPAQVVLSARTLENGGTILWTGAGTLVMDTAAVITNRANALFEVRNNAAFFAGDFSGGAPRLDNAGTFRKTIATGTTSFAAPFSSGVALNNYGTTDIRSGIILANGIYTSTASSVLSSAIGGTTPGTGYGQLQVAGSVTLNGALSVGLANGFLPAVNDSFTVLSAGSRSGTFASFSYPSNAVTMQLSNTTSSVILWVTGVAVPPPLLFSPALSGSNVLLTWTSISNANYRLEFNPDLNPSNWSALAGDVPGISNTANKLDVLTPSNRFYRVRVLP